MNQQNMHASTADGTHTVSLDDSGVLIEWDFINKRIVRRMQAPIPSTTAALAGDTSTAVFMSKGGAIILYDLATGTFRKIIDFSILRSTDTEREQAASPSLLTARHFLPAIS
jgi:hypothetical protein